MIRAILNYILRASEYDQEKTRGDVLYKGYIDSTHRIKELEAERDYLDTKCAAFENDFVLLDVTEKLKKAEARIAELEEALAKGENEIMTKRSTNLNRWRKAGSTEVIADLMQMFGVSADELRAWAQKNAGTSRKRATCPRCGKWIEIEVNNLDGTSVCPACENNIVVLE